MQILTALFLDTIDLRQVDGPSTRIDLTGIQFSAVAPTPPPLVWAPHLVIIAHAPETESGQGVLEVIFTTDPTPPVAGADGPEPLARNVQPFQVEPGKFSYRLVRAELEFPDYGTIYAHCNIDRGIVTTVPYTLLPAPAE